MVTYVNDLRLSELATGEGSGTWGTTTNTNLELIGEALGYGTQNCFTSDANATTTVADGSTDPARAMYFKVTSSATLSATRELTIAPNTVNRVMIIENATTGSQIITIKQGSGNTVNVGNGAVKILYLDGAGSGAAVQDALVDLDLTGTTSAVNLDISGNIDVDGTTNLDAVDIDGAVQIDNTITVGADDTGYDVKFFGATSGAYMLWDESADDLKLVGAAGLTVAGNVDIDGTLETDAFSINGTTVSATAAELNVLDPAHKEINSIYIGSDPSGTTDTGSSYNVAIGVNALDAVTTSGYNTAVGAEALGKTTTGDLNVAYGYKALTESTVGDRNTAVGYEALRDVEPASKTDMYNVALGFKAGTNASAGTDFTGTKNTLLGSFAGAELTSGDSNVAVGYLAGGGSSGSAATGDGNVAVGDNALNVVVGGHSNVAVGKNALIAATSAQNNVAVGYQALDAATTSFYNVAVGSQALGANDTGNYNTAVGYAALRDQNGSANYNTAVGYTAMQNTTTSSNNVAVGGFAMQSNTTGDSNVAVGYQALDASQQGDRNTAVGYQALTTLNPSGNVDTYNSAFGYRSLASLTTGVANTALGFGSLENTTTGANNTAVGGAALQVNDGDRNTAVGYNSLQANSSGDYNTALGYNSLVSNTSGNYNVGIGYEALDATDDGANNTAVGYGALGANCGDTNTAVGSSAGMVITGSNNSCLGNAAGGDTTSGGNNSFIGKDSGRSGSPGGSITTGSNEIVLGDENISEAHIQVDWTVASDARDKTDFTALDLGLDFVKALKPVTYKWDKRSKYGDKYADDYDLNAQTPDGTHKEDWLDIGFKAQEVEALEIAAGYNKDNKTNLVSSHSDDGKQMGLQYSKFVPILVKAIQEQQTLIESLTARIAALES